MWLILTIIIIFIAFQFILRSQKNNVQDRKSKSKSATGEISSKRIMTENEIHLYEKLKQLLPQYTIFSQVSFSAFLYSKDYATRATYNRKIIDFVILDGDYQVACLIELDDNSHRNRADQDRQRDELCSKAGYRVVRFASQPNLEQMKKQLGFLIPSIPQEKSPNPNGEDTEIGQK
ncbi:hypothetical protein A3K93_06140 [Acinetobacter sp. NCu2D-2]|uniref:DUF2726 domain-containing protein n=1 Tax=Acinetobacter sp. NCu2D-2 TaxID=1608473 RepID=UPI0007CDFD14|nr:DUF2726 domain-containing protein [Acinetobacter sp. NCu2D-2]ANF81810.1 hypothetical protein A3K93_06140 [Acinetobacter sp. NCu2D-2]